MRTAKAEGRAVFDTALDSLAVVGGFAIDVSKRLTGQPTDTAGELSSIVHAKLCAHVRSMGELTRSPLFDHSAFAALGRMVMECMTMFFYLKEPVEEPVWRLRYALLRLHDTVCRIKLLRMPHFTFDTDDLRRGRTSIENEIRSHPFVKSMSPDLQKRTLSGEELFLGGMRAAATRAAGWNGDTFTSLYSYFSSHAHTAPMSFFRAVAHGTDYVKPSEAQLGLAALAMEVAEACARRATLAYLRTSPEVWNALPVSFLSAQEEEDRNTNLFTPKAAD